MILCSSAPKLGCQSHQVHFLQLINLNHQFSLGRKSSHYSCHFFLAVLQFQAQLQPLKFLRNAFHRLWKMRPVRARC